MGLLVFMAVLVVRQMLGKDPDPVREASEVTVVAEGGRAGRDDFEEEVASVDNGESRGHRNQASEASNEDERPARGTARKVQRP